jgi:hypothetical protein
VFWSSKVIFQLFSDRILSGLIRCRVFGGVVASVVEISLLATGHKTSPHRFEFLPPRAGLPGFTLKVAADEAGSAKNMVIIVTNQASNTGRRYRPPASSLV